MAALGGGCRCCARPRASRASLYFIAMAVFALSMVLLYAASTTYHTVDSTDKVNRRLRKLDHMMIFVLIAGSYTPICLITLRGPQGTALCAAVWAVAPGGHCHQSPVDYLPQVVFFRAVHCHGLAVRVCRGAHCERAVTRGVWLAFGGRHHLHGGGVLYALKLPLFNARHKVFGTHEIFHVFVMAGSACHYVLMYFFVMPALA